MKNISKKYIDKFPPVNGVGLKKKHDILFITPDVYVDIPSLPVPLLTRFLQRKDYYPAIVSRPLNVKDIGVFGKPRYAVAISGGVMDSMLYHYTAFLKTRSEDPLSPDNNIHTRPKRTIIKYTSMVKSLYKDIPVIIGGIEGSMRRFTHYDYWTGKIRKPILLDSKADILVYGMGEYPLLEILNRIKNGRSYIGVRSTVVVFHQKDKKLWEEIKNRGRFVELPSYEDIVKDKSLLLKQSLLLEENSNPYLNIGLYQRVGSSIVVSFPPWLPLNEKEMDFIYDFPFLRLEHPIYNKKFSFLDTTRFSVVTHRGCFGGCSFCAISLHQGKFIQSRSVESIKKEVKSFVNHPYFKGVVNDVGGPSANMYRMKGIHQNICKKCVRPSCIYPDVCINLDTTNYHHKLLKELSKIEGIKKIKVSSGIRYDLALEDEEYIKDIATKFSSGRLKIAPEHTEDSILKLMKKPSFNIFMKFLKKYRKYTKSPVTIYVITGFPGSTMKINDMMKKKLSKLHLLSNQHQSFTPTPLTLATAFFVSKRDEKGNKLYIPDLKERYKQWASLIYKKNS